MAGVAAVGTSHYVAARPRGPPRASMAKRAAIGQSRADGKVNIDVSAAVPFVCSLALRAGKFSLEELTAAPDRAKRACVLSIICPQATFVSNRGSARLTIRRRGLFGFIRVS